MTKRPMFCPRCGEFLKRKDKVCPNCGTQIVARQKDEAAELEKIRQERNARIEQKVVLSENISQAKREQLEKEAAKRKAEEEKMAAAEVSGSGEKISNSKRKKLEQDKKKAQKKKGKPHKKPVLVGVSTDADGKKDINVSDVSFFAEEEKKKTAGKKYKMPEKLKWYDIFKWADRWLARRKINRVVNKAATEMPDYVNKWTMVFLCLFFGYMGAHSLYAKNWVRGFVVLGAFAATIVVFSVDVLKTYVGISIGGGFGLVFLLTWVIDFVRILLNRYRYRTSRNNFIETLNFETRAILGKRYIKKEIAEMKAQEQETNEQKN